MSVSKFKKRKLGHIENYTFLLQSSYYKNSSVAEKKAKMQELMKKYMNHHFLETNPRNTVNVINRLEEKFIIHNQLQKAERLQKLVKLLLTKKLNQNVLDINHVVLDTLLNLSYNPLHQGQLMNNSIVDRKIEQEAPDKDPFNINSQNLAVSSDNDSKDFRENDDLSEEWSQFDEEENVENGFNAVKTDSDLKKDDLDEKEASAKKTNTFSTGIMTRSSWPNENAFYGGMQYNSSYQNNLSDLSKDNKFIGKKRRLNQSFSDSDSEDSGSRNIVEDIFYDEKNWPIGLLNDPNSTLKTIKNFTLEEQEKNRYMYRETGINHWLYEMKDEREIVQDLLQLMQGCSSNLFEMEETQSGRIKLSIKKPLEMSHLSMVSLKSELNEFIEFQEVKIYVIKSIERWKKLKLRTQQRFFQRIDEFFNKFSNDVNNWNQIFAMQTGLIKDKISSNAKSNFNSTIDQSNKMNEEIIYSNQNENYQANCKDDIEMDNQRNSKIAQHPLTILTLYNYITPYARSFVLLKVFFEKLEQSHNNWLIYLKKLTLGDEQDDFNKNYNAFITREVINTLDTLQKQINQDQENNEKWIFLSYIDVQFDYIDYLRQWLETGRVNDPYNEFFIYRAKDLNYKGNEFKIDWSEDFNTRIIDHRNGNIEFIAPNVLTSTLVNILYSGKSSLLISYLNLNNQDKTELMNCNMNLEGCFSRNLLKNLQSAFYLESDQENHSELQSENKMIEEKICLSVNPNKVNFDLGEESPYVQKKNNKKDSSKNIENKIQSGTFGMFQKEELFHQVDMIYSKPLNTMDNLIDLKSDMIQDNFGQNSGNSFLPQNFSLGNTQLDQVNYNDFFGKEKQKFMDFEQRITRLKEFHVKNNNFNHKKFVCDESQSLQTFDIINFYHDNEDKLISKKSFSKVLSKCIKKAILNTEETISSQLTSALTICFDLKNYFDTVLSIYFLEKIHVIGDSFDELIDNIDSYQFSISPQKFADVIYEMARKVNPQIAHHFVIDRYGMSPTFKKYFNNQEFSINLKAPFPLGIIFNKDLIQKYNKIFLFLFHLKRAKQAVNNKFYFQKQFRGINVADKRKDYDEDNYKENAFETYNFLYETDNDTKDYMFNFSKRLRAVQAELNNFVTIYERFLRESIINFSKKNLMETLTAQKGLQDIIESHNKFVDHIYEMCFLSEKVENILDIFLKCLDACTGFGHLVKEFENVLVFDDRDKIKDLTKINDGVKELLINFRKSVAKILNLLYKYKKQEIRFQYTEIFTELNFNNFYLNEYGEVNLSTINYLTPSYDFKG